LVHYHSDGEDEETDFNGVPASLCAGFFYFSLLSYIPPGKCEEFSLFLSLKKWHYRAEREDMIMKMRSLLPFTKCRRGGLSVLLAALSLTAVLAGCSGKTETPTAATAETAAAETTGTASTVPTIIPEDVTIRVGSLKGPTSMGLVHLMDLSEQGTAGNNYEFTMFTAADELLAKIAVKDLDIALVPANIASVLYNKTQAITVIDINTLGVLDIVASDDSIKSIADLKGKTLYLTGKGTTPEYVINYLLAANGLTTDDVSLEFKSEATEVAVILKEQPDSIGLLPQPFVTAACAQNENLKIVLDLTKEWQAVQGAQGSQLVTGVTVVRKEFLEENPNAIALFLQEHLASSDFANANVDETAELIARLGIVEKAAIAKKALPYCNITCITGEPMREALSGYLGVLAEQAPASIGGQVPDDGFYFLP